MGKVINLFGPSVGQVEQGRAPGQISLPFTARQKLITMLTSQSSGVEGFPRLITALSVHLILDMRIAPRLDFIAATRAKAFALFDSHEVEYRDVLGRIGATSYDNLGLPTIMAMTGNIIQNSKSRGSPVLALFDSPAFRDVCSHFFDGIYEVDCLDDFQVVHLETEERLRM